MPRYSFVARGRSGSPEKGFVEAQNSEEAVTILQARDLIVVSIRENQSKQPAAAGSIRTLRSRIKPSDLSIFARSLSAMTEAGLPLLRAMELVGEQTRSGRFRAVVQEMVRDIRAGSTFRDAIAKHSKVFSSFWVSLIETGEASGQLTKALEQIGNHLEKAGTVQRKVVSALIYPAILVIVAIGAVLVFTLKIIPTFAQLFASLGSELPFLTRLVIGFSNLLRKKIFLVIGGMALLWFLFASYRKTPAGRWQIDQFLLRAPIFGPVVQGVIAERFASDLSTLLKAGVPILHALDIVTASCPNKVVALVLEHVRTAVREGRSLAEPLARTDVFPPMVAQMVAVGEQTGKLSTMLEEVAQFYDEQVTTAVERMTTLLEPIMLVTMGIVIGLLVLAMYLPVFQISQGFKG